MVVAIVLGILGIFIGLLLNVCFIPGMLIITIGAIVAGIVKKVKSVIDYLTLSEAEQAAKKKQYAE